MKNLLNIILSIILLLGSIFAWYTVYVDFSKFYFIYHSFFRINNCIVPNPIVTPCFYGAFAFVVAFIWSLLLFKKAVEIRVKQQKYLLYFLIGSNIFAWSNFVLQLVKFLQAGSKPIIGCSGQLMTNPFTTPCFVGSAFFLVALVVAITIHFFNNNKLLPPNII